MDEIALFNSSFTIASERKGADGMHCNQRVACVTAEEQCRPDVVIPAEQKLGQEKAKADKVFLAPIEERVLLNAGSEKQTYHLVIGLEGSQIEYQVGDCLGIYPQNDPSVVEKVLRRLKASGDEIIEDRHKKADSLLNFLQNRANLQRLPEMHEGFLHEGSLSDFCKKLPPLLPRFYSIASSMNNVGKRAHLTVGLVDGTCTQYLCKRAPLGVAVLPIFHHPSRNFTLSSESFDSPIIMVGPGTGIAPFRGFMQERMHKKTAAISWLFFGEWREAYDFYYQSYWEELVSSGKLVMDVAFSRDGEEKVYVQHKMLEKSEQIWSWLNQGAYLFVCGDASKMAKAVDQTLHTIIEKQGGFSPEGARDFVKGLKKEKRYLRDVY